MKHGRETKSSHVELPQNQNLDGRGGAGGVVVVEQGRTKLDGVGRDWARSEEVG